MYVLCTVLVSVCRKILEGEVEKRRERERKAERARERFPVQQRLTLIFVVNLEMCEMGGEFVALYTGKNHQFIVKDVKPGYYSVRVQAFSTVGPGEWSIPHDIIVTKGGQLLSPLLSSPLSLSHTHTHTHTHTNYS